MFTVFNRDVILRVTVILFLLAFVSPAAVLARGGKATYDKKTKLYSRHNTSHERHNKSLKVKKSQNRKEKSSSKNISANSRNHTSSIKKALPKKDNVIFYKVKKGDTLTFVSKKYNIPIDSILSINNLKNENKIKKGFIIKIPAHQSTSVTSKKNNAHEQKPVRSATPRFQWPVLKVIGYHNDGVDGVKPIGIVITGKPGSVVLSSASGTVKKIGSMRGFGKYIVIHHAGRFATVYANLDQITVSEGDTIKGGNAIGRINNFDRKLHFQIDLEGKPENPLKYLPKNI
jgi:lipoprotein NlpD